MDRAITCCFTGHRPEKMPFAVSQYGYDYQMFRRRLEQAVQCAILAGYRHFITGMSRGMDLWAAEFVLAFRVPYPDITLEAAIPFPGQADRWREADQRIYHDILSRCDTQTVLSPAYHTGCMDQRNRYMVDHSSLLIAAYAGGSGGTHNTCAYAERQGVRIQHILSDEQEYAGSLF